MTDFLGKGHAKAAAEAEGKPPEETKAVVPWVPTRAADFPWPEDYPTPEALLRFLVENDITAVAKNPAMRAAYILWRCKQDNVDPTTKPWIFIPAKDDKGAEKLVPYPTKSWAAQKRKNEHVTIEVLEQTITPEGVFIVRVRATLPDGRFDDDIGAVGFKDRKGIMADPGDQAVLFRKAYTQAKRRATLSLLGEGTDEARDDEDRGGPLEAPRVLEPAPRKGRKNADLSLPAETTQKALPEAQEATELEKTLSGSAKTVEAVLEPARPLPATPTPPTPAPVRVTETGRKVFDPRKRS